MTKEKDILEVLRHCRHDWLNVIQLIKGNLALRRYDRVEEVLETTIQQLMNESKLSNLGIPSISTRLLTFNWSSHPYKLGTEVIGDVTDLSLLEVELEQFVGPLLFIFENHCMAEQENHLLITFQLFPNSCRLTFDFQGGLKEIHRLRRGLLELVKDKWESGIELKENECVFSISLEKK
ncbi:Spo0B C-terminal domain-containing protein [Halalkalibacterium ligniniphilum]|uniref:Spo0B C-terminal domain-containing protein n=1 Tax=Halalkalibacterium ligniniphilum TaxID=1134413 RepID=UPI000346E74F|nr:Spo0B C-terminal domain-containing protein [Halalkalibacterium ligniniphilum]